METGILSHWTKHVQLLNQAERELFEKQRPHTLPALITGAVVIDWDRRWSPGETMRSNLLLSFDLQRMTATTASGSVYKLQGRGYIKLCSSLPRTAEDAAYAVGEQIMRERGIEVIQISDMAKYEDSRSTALKKLNRPLEEIFAKYGR